MHIIKNTSMLKIFNHTLITPVIKYLVGWFWAKILCNPGSNNGQTQYVQGYIFLQIRWEIILTASTQLRCVLSYDDLNWEDKLLLWIFRSTQ